VISGLPAVDHTISHEGAPTAAERRERERHSRGEPARRAWAATPGHRR
jgi:hypothetical protein